MDPLRDQLERHLRRPLPDAVWRYLDEHNYVDEVRDGSADLEYLAGEARELLDMVQARELLEMVQAREPTEQAAGNRPPSGREHAWAQSVVIAARARQDPDVRTFRKEVLADELMEWADVPAWVEDQAAKSPEVVDIKLRTEVPEGGGQAGLRAAASRRLADARFGVGVEVLKYSAPGDEWVRIQPIRKGPLEWLHRLSQSLAPAYAWTESQASVFLLTDVTPLIGRIRATVTGGTIRHRQVHEWSNRIVLNIDPSTSTSEVAATYVAARRGAGHGSRRRLSSKHALLAAHQAQQPDGSTWQQSLEAWNQKHPTWRYSHQSNFRRDALRAQARLLYPDWFPGQTPLSDPQI